MCVSVTTILFDMKNIFAKISPYHEMILICFVCFFNILATEVETMYQHIVSFMLKSSSDKCWQQIFTLKNTLNIHNILQLVEICLVLPISNAEVERVFSTFSKIMTRDR